MHVPGLRVDGGDHPVRGDPAGDAPPPVGAVGALGRLDVLPGDQRQQRHRLRGLARPDRRSGAARPRSVLRVVDQRRHQRVAGGLVVPGDARLARIVPVMGVAPRAISSAAPGTSRRTRRTAAISWVTVSWVATASSKHRPSPTPAGSCPSAPRSAAITARTASKIRSGRSEARSRLPPHRQRRRVEPLMVDRQPARHLPPQIAAHRLHRLPVREVLQRLQHQHRGDHLGRHRRPAAARTNRSANIPSGNTSPRCSARNAYTLPAGTRCPTNAAASSNCRSTREDPCTPPSPTTPRDQRDMRGCSAES